MKHTLAAAAFTALLLSTAAFADDAGNAAAPTAGKDYVMLRVSGDDIMRSEVDESWKSVFQGRDVPPFDTMDPKVQAKFLREVASEHVLYKEAEKEGVDKSPNVSAALEKLKHQVVIQELLKTKTEPSMTDDKLKADYDAHLKASADGSPDHDELKARHILVKTKDEADAIEKKLKGGEDFGKLAKEKSQDKASGAAGGDLGWFTADKMLPEFSAATLKLKKGEISPPVKTDFGWHVIQLEDRRKPQPPSYDEVKDTLKQEVATNIMGDYVKKLMENVKIAKVDAAGHESTLAPEEAAPAGGKPEDAGAQ